MMMTMCNAPPPPRVWIRVRVMVRYICELLMTTGIEPLGLGLGLGLGQGLGLGLGLGLDMFFDT